MFKLFFILGMLFSYPVPCPPGGRCVDATGRPHPAERLAIPDTASLHLTTTGSRQPWPVWASKSSAATGPQVPVA
jgi:hypothetical protein